MSSGMLDIGDRVAGFEVESFVARGGMAFVYRARDLRLSRTVALKVMAPELASEAGFRHRFTRESELAASIDHPNIIPIYAAGEENGLLYLVMRYVPGQHLGDVLKENGPLPPADVSAIFGQVAEALDAAHAHGLVHRDVKPANILLVGTGALAERHVYLSDFGLTTKISADGDTTTTATEAGVLGTLKYVAPERVTGSASDHRADIYSFGCVLFEALAGQPPFVRTEEAAWLYAHVAEPPPPLRQFRPDLPPELDAVLGRALAKDPQGRYPDCRSLVRDLQSALAADPVGPGSERTEPFARADDADRAPTTMLPVVSPITPPLGAPPLHEPPAGTPPAPPPQADPVPRAGLDPNFRPYQPTPAELPPLPAAAAGSATGNRSRRGLAILLSLAAVLVVAAVVVAVIWLRPGSGAGASGPDQAAIDLPQSAEPLPDDVFLWRHQVADVWKIETATVEGQPQRTLLTARENRAVVLSRDRRTILYLREQDDVVTLRAIAADGGDDKALFSDSTTTCPRLGRPALRADGLLVAVCYERPNGPGRLNLMRADGTVIRTLDEGRVGDPTLSADGSRVVYWQADADDVVGGRLRIARVDGSTGPSTLLEGEDGELADPAWSPAADVIVYRRWVGDDQWLQSVPVADLTAGRPERLTPKIYYDQGPSWSPDGSRILFRRGSDKSSALLVTTADGGEERRVATNDGYSASPIWSAR